jgi:hypothetical protein
LPAICNDISASVLLRSLLFIFYFFFICTNSSSQASYVVIDSVQIKGLLKTSHNVVFKEIDLHSGDTISLDQLAKRLGSNEKRLQSIGLFTLVNINIKNWNTDLNICNVEIQLQENWFIYPYIIFELADRNFNVWRKEQNYSFDRVNYGLALTHINFSGSKDKLKVKAQFGYTKKYELAYDFPYLKDKWGLSTNVVYSENREIAYISENNKPRFYRSKDDKKVFFQYRASISLHHRTNPLTFQTLRLEFISAKTDSMISGTLNKEYFGMSANRLRYFLIDYTIRFDNTLYPLYPVGGHRMELAIRKEGLGLYQQVDNTWISLKAEKHTPLKNWLILSNKVKVKLNLQDNPLPYFLNAGIGYRDDVITGYQLYVLDGRNFFILNNALKCRLSDKDIKLTKYMPRQFRVMNLKLFVRSNFDIGYASDPVFGYLNPYSNNIQFGYGPAVDIILFNNLTLSCEYSITRFNQRGFYFKSGFNF